MPRRAAVPFVLLLGCAHARHESVVASMATLGPRLLVLAAEEPLVASGASDLLCIAGQEDWSVQVKASALVPPGGVPIRLDAKIAGEDGEVEVDLPVASERRVGQTAYLCLGPRVALAKGARFTRAAVLAGSLLLVPQILWLGAPP